jgi:hypothetical protein
MKNVYWLLTVAMLLSDTLSHAQSGDPALVGSRLIRVEQAGNKVPILLEIPQTGEYSLARVNEERGFITTDPESWHLNSPEMSHGKYSVKNADACSINSTISPGDWIELERVPAGNQRSRVDPSLLPEDMKTPHRTR